MEETEVQGWRMRRRSQIEGRALVTILGESRTPRPDSAVPEVSGVVLTRGGCGVLADASVGGSPACGLRHHGMRRADQSPPRPRISATITGQITQTQS